MVAEHLAEAVFHSMVAALVADALLRAWRIEAPSFRVRLRLLALVLPLILVPLYEWAAPFRHEPWFRDRFALFAGSRWGRFDVLGLRLDRWWLLSLAAAAVALLLLDVVPALRQRAARLPSIPPPEALRRLVEGLSRKAGIAPPEIEVPQTSALTLMCRGLRAPRLVVSTGALEALDDGELEAAVAHELAHVKHRDLHLGWLLLGARVAHAFNPVAQALSRVIGHEAERRADDWASEIGGSRPALASSVLKVFRANRRAGGSAALTEVLLTHAHQDVLERRCRRLLHPAPPPPAGANLRLAASALALSALLFFVT